MTPQPAPPVQLISFGYLHQRPEAEVVVDVRLSLRDPAVRTDLLDLTGQDPRVRAVVLDTPGARDLLGALLAHVHALRALPPDRPRRIAIGCAGGRHRSVALVDALAAALAERGVTGTVEHLHVHLPRVLKPAKGDTAWPTEQP
ncbi:RNase adapter RapZ [Actinokineospora sp. NBRC 105648]|uniref:RapZ C-terminal domain-containing protein n=1 Tax=Actinokineospora sp. NBRC 105648 TaxID=3032206 RepID=UPI0024A0DADC|nr:RNase adapter RapZ [Actinokineospora sp. NBRC 105648]GLZ43512.1 hypothetical protein Acsp05_71360 [Actinokineospora sp. NBRC 105648]